MDKLSESAINQMRNVLRSKLPIGAAKGLIEKARPSMPTPSGRRTAAAQVTVNNVDTLVPVGALEVMAMRGERPVIVDGRIYYNPKKTECVWEDTDFNLVVNSGRKLINELINGRQLEADPITTMCTGEGDGSADPPSPSGTDTDLLNLLWESGEGELMQAYPNELATTYIVHINENQSNGTIREFGLKTRSGKLFARRTIKPRPKDTQTFLVCRWTIQH